MIEGVVRVRGKDVIAVPNLRKVRESTGYSRSEFAGVMGVNPWTYTNYERGSNRCPIELVEEFAKAAEVDVEAITGDPNKVRFVGTEEPPEENGRELYSKGVRRTYSGATIRVDDREKDYHKYGRSVIIDTSRYIRTDRDVDRVSRAVGISRSTVYKTVRGNAPVLQKVAIGISKWAGVPLDELVNWELQKQHRKDLKNKKKEKLLKSNKGNAEEEATGVPEYDPSGNSAESREDIVERMARVEGKFNSTVDNIDRMLAAVEDLVEKVQQDRQSREDLQQKLNEMTSVMEQVEENTQKKSWFR